MVEEKLKASLREYTVLGISEVFKAIVSKDFADFFEGKTLKEILIVIKEGSFYHFQIEEDVKILAKAFLNQINENKLDLSRLYSEFDKQVAILEKIYCFSHDNYSWSTALEFFNLYGALIKIAYASAYSADFIEPIDKEKRKEVMIWIEKLRIRGENIYKYGEKVFIPKLLSWMSTQLPPGYTVDSLQFLISDELRAFIEKKSDLPSPDRLMARKELLYVSFTPFTNINLLEGGQVKEIIEKRELFKDDTDYENIQEFHGVYASPGRVLGKVRLIFSTKDMVKFKENEIIVSPMTDPSYVPIMEKALAFVTDEGGVLCHAAIVARELNKPCITGTKIATKVLKDGDLVEVNANTGIVKLISRAKKQ